jgi:hypothetical protein
MEQARRPHVVVRAVHVTLEDCADDTTCKVVADQTQIAYTGGVYPGRSDEFELASLGSPGMRLKGRPRWRCEVTKISANPFVVRE